jgi:peptide/nickel transport system permease protein
MTDAIGPGAAASVADSASTRAPLGDDRIAARSPLPGPRGPRSDDRMASGERPLHRLALFLWRDRSALVGLLLIVLVLLFSFVGPILYPTDQIHTNLTGINLPPSSQHLLGTDDLGYDVLGRIMLGGQSSIEIGLAVAVLATTLGAIWGSLAALTGGVVDTLMMRVVDVLLAIPALFIIIFLATVVRPNLWSLIGVIAFVSWLVPSLLVRGESLSIRALPFVEASRRFGARQLWILRRHIVPNAVGVIVVNATFQVADAVLILAYLSFLGFGLPPPASSWGGILAEGLNNMFNGYWWEIYPAGIIIVITVIAFNLLGDSLRDLVDARLRGR